MVGMAGECWDGGDCTDTHGEDRGWSGWLGVVGMGGTVGTVRSSIVTSPE